MNKNEIVRRIKRIKKLRSSIQEKSSALYAEMLQLEKELRQQKTCEHPLTSEYRWEHDDGYGRQHWITGLQCDLCGMKSSWGHKGGPWWDPNS